MTSKTRNDIIMSMCYTWRHDYGLDAVAGDVVSSGMTEKERSALWNAMAQLFDNDISPFMEFKHE